MTDLMRKTMEKATIIGKRQEYKMVGCRKGSTKWSGSMGSQKGEKVTFLGCRNIRDDKLIKIMEKVWAMKEE